MESEIMAPKTDEEVITNIKAMLGVDTLIDAERAIKKLTSKRVLISADAAGNLYMASMTAGSLVKIVGTLQSVLDNTVIGEKT